MAYLGNDLQVAYQSYQIIDDISSSFNGVLTTFPLQVGGVTPVPFPINPQQCLISVNGVIQEPDPSGTSGFNLVGSNIEFSSAPTGGHAFFGVILAGADYVNIGVKYPSGSESAPSITFDTDLDTGIYNPGDNELGFSTNSIQRLKIDSSGRLLVGTSSTSEITRAVFQGNSSSNPGRVYFTTASAAPSSGATLAKLIFADSGHVSAAEIDVQRDGGTWTSGSSQPTRLVFSTTADGESSPTERMRIAQDGRIFFDQARFDAGGGLWLTPSSFDRVVQRCGTSTTGDAGLIEFINPNGLVGSITVNGSATAYNTSSDYRLKENVTPVTDGITRLQQLKPSRFNFIADPAKTVDGFLAHEVQTIVPEAITGEKDAVDDEGNPEYQGIDQSKLVPLLTAALQEAVAKIETLEAKVAALESA